MRIWVVSRNGTPRAVFSTAGGANDYVAGSGSTSRCDVQWFVLDACDDHDTQRFMLTPSAVNSNRAAGALR
jgi:hypothetical protein